jgi:hypothetical protein
MAHTHTPLCPRRRVHPAPARTGRPNGGDTERAAARGEHPKGAARFMIQLHSAVMPPPLPRVKATICRT